MALSKSPLWTPPDVEEARQLETAQGHLANAQAALNRAFTAAQNHGDVSSILYWREQVSSWQSTVNALTLKPKAS